MATALSIPASPPGFDYDGAAAEILASIKREGRYREFVEVSRLAGRFPTALHRLRGEEREITVWCSLDFMGMGQDEAVQRALLKSVESSGVGSGGSRNIAGNCAEHVALERELASFHGRDSALLFTSGYVANLATLSTLGKMLGRCVFLSDSKNHNSIIEGIKASRCERRIFAHNDPDDLVRQIADLPRSVPKVIAFESLYSMDGDVAPIERYIEIAGEYNALTYLDEVHAIGGYGPTGAGMSEQIGCADRISIIQGTLAKGVGLIGGYIAGSAPMIDAIRCNAPGFIFTVSLPPYISAAAIASIGRLKGAAQLRERLRSNSELFRRQAIEAGIDVGPSRTHIVPVMVREAKKCKEIAAYLLEDRKLYLQPVNYPSVPKGEDRLRVSVSALHNEAQIISCVGELREALARFS